MSEAEAKSTERFSVNVSISAASCCEGRSDIHIRIFVVRLNPMDGEPASFMDNDRYYYHVKDEDVAKIKNLEFVLANSCEGLGIALDSCDRAELSAVEEIMHRLDGTLVDEGIKKTQGRGQGKKFDSHYKVIKRHAPKRMMD